VALPAAGRHQVVTVLHSALLTQCTCQGLACVFDLQPLLQAHPTGSLNVLIFRLNCQLQQLQHVSKGDRACMVRQVVLLLPAATCPGNMQCP
jgi:hypothetical protein